MRLMREVRFRVGAGESAIAGNSWSGSPGSLGLHAYVALRAVVAGEPDADTGFVCNIKHIDHLLRERALPVLEHAAADGRSISSLMVELWTQIEPNVPCGTRLARIELTTSPHQEYMATCGDVSMVVLTESFEFSASHRLAGKGFSDQQNLDVFGKCANANGHGHNYVVQVSVAGMAASQGQPAVCEQLHRVVGVQVVDRFDHKHLNLDCPEFTALNPTVENITRVIWDLLIDRLAPIKLQRIRVYETPKTYAEYDGS